MAREEWLGVGGEESRTTFASTPNCRLLRQDPQLPSRSATDTGTPLSMASTSSSLALPAVKRALRKSVQHQLRALSPSAIQAQCTVLLCPSTPSDTLGTDSLDKLDGSQRPPPKSDLNRTLPLVQVALDLPLDAAL